MLLLEQRDSSSWWRIDRAAQEAGLAVTPLESVEAIPPDAAVVAVGPSVREPLQVARYLRRCGAQALLVFLTGSSSARDELQAELIRDPFLYPRYELIELPDNPRQLATRMGRVVAQAERQFHAAASAGPRRRPRSRTAVRARAAAGDHYLSNVLAQASEAFVSTDAAGRILTWNQAAERLFGIAASAALGQPLALLDPPESVSIGAAAIAQRVLATGEAEQAQATCRTGNEDSVGVAVSVAPVRDARGALLGLSIIARDDSEIQRIEEALRTANRQKDEFLAIMSHELRTPLTSILGYTDMLLRGLSGPLAPLANKYIGNVRSAGDRLLDLVNGLLDYTRLEAGVERLELQPLDLPALVAQDVLHFKMQADAKAIDLRLSIGSGIGRVEADAERLSHVIRSYIGNAIKFTPGPGWVTVHLGPDPEARDRVRVSVADSGIGLTSDQAPRVWERFYQGDASLTRPYGGMGLGLSIAKHLVSLHGGAVGADSPGPGLGSTFWFSLPLARAS